ncbi:hypothetical protein NPS01_25820 [Nocardioides psychrotolerans]|uniref:Uncharacterized conserved protein YbcC, UPF0753/DUF2309 family n=1 Tax=Nocardioides psychrotolerans TaxID=1005945 RepID=A0A1I3LTU3_9ACTN|nr:putative inorganic carbon transporter subunit DabA [Nocardioides psychrotolerans]GEP38919.1 hypothetical protein NPS01_25820 [Nocardioides psychrotolerans]SFI88204.1 Uncharacterized conserved protein YbcC, UPF0753/DUF2309 family [Nocardioides psychrotolerans]
MTTLRLSRRAATVLLVLAAASGVHLATGRGPLNVGPEVAGISLGLHLDLTATLLYGFVGALGWVVTTYSLTNLSGQHRVPRLGYAFTVALLALALLIGGASLPVMALGWTLSGLAASWLVGHPANAGARRAASGMRRSLAVGDAAVWTLVVVAAYTLPSLDRADLTSSAAEVDHGTGFVLAALLVIAFVTRSALPPTQRWLLETTEAPSPVSAFLHAGVVNGGGVLLLLLWPLLATQRPALGALVLLGATALVIGTWSMNARDDVKGRLACSTTTQMGFVAIQLGLALPAAALLHVIGHGAWKSWLFLRAGGAVQRSSTSTFVRGDRRSTLLVGLPLAVGLAVGTPPAVDLVEASGPAGLLPVGLAVLFALTGGFQLAAVDRAGQVKRAGAGVVIGAAAAGALWIVALWKQSVSGGLVVAGQGWPDLPAALLLALVAAALITAWAGAIDLQRRPTGPIAVALLLCAVSPGLTRRQDARWPDVSAPSEAPGKRALTDADVALAVQVARRVVGAAWPLGSSVAVNPVAPLESIPFADAVGVARRHHGAELLPQLDWFLRQWAEGGITSAALLEALNEAGHPGCFPTPVNLADFITSSEALRDQPSSSTTALRSGVVPRLCEALPDRVCAERAARRVDQEASWWCQRAWAQSSATGPGPWQLWRAAAAGHVYPISAGLRGVDRLVKALPSAPLAAIAAMTSAASIPGPSLVGYVIRLLVTAPGWAAHARWRSEQGQTEALLELVALRMALDLLHAGSAGGTALDVRPQLEPAGGAEFGDDHRLVWQRALELTVQQSLLPALVHAEGRRSPAPGQGQAAQTQSLWCIDVRSERVRRHVEALGRHHTFGVAGFFGVATRHRHDGHSTDQCPVLLVPSSESRSDIQQRSLRQILHRAVSGTSSTPAVPLLSAEAYGGAAAVVSAVSSIWPTSAQRTWSAWVHGSDLMAPPLWSTDTETKVAAIEGTLRAVGLVDDFAPLVLVVGHAASAENNAHRSTYQCGACGANSGFVNARLFAEAMNDPDVRQRLRGRGIDVPATTLAMAAVHDTTTDLIELAPEGADGQHRHPLHVGALDEARGALAEAGRRAAQERVPRLPRVRRAASGGAARRAATRRSTDWSEPTPEWGLAGNRAIILAPRWMTTGLNLGGQVFLHSYERSQDIDHQVLDQLMAAPVVVSQWISAQYQFSTTAHEVFGAGDKTTLNVVGDVGVLAGAHGDLRLGLPWQSLFEHSPTDFPSPHGAHDPVRHLVIVAADKDAILTSIRNHVGLRQLAEHQWATFVAIDQGAHELGPDLEWRTLLPQARLPQVISTSPFALRRG